MVITSLRGWYRAMYSTYVVLKAIWVFNLEDQVTEHSAKEMMYPVLDLAVQTSFMVVERFQFPQKSASAYTSKDFPFCGSRINHFSLSRRIYLHIYITASACGSIGASLKRAH
jgi:hypothetical protein